MAEQTSPTGVQMDAIDDKGAPVTIYSRTGPKTEAEFAAAMDQYNTPQYPGYGIHGLVPKGFIVLPPGTMNDIRQKFESYIGNPMRSVAGMIQQSPDMPATSQYMPDVVQKPVANAANFLKNTAASIPQQLSTPEGLTTAVGTTAGALATSGSSLPWQIVGNALGAGVGNLVGTAVTGGPTDPSETARQMLGAAAGTTAMGAFKYFLGTGVSQQAKEGIVAKLSSLLEKEYGPISASPQALEAILSTKGGALKVAQIGAEALRGDMNRLVTNMQGDIQAALPTHLPVGIQNTFRAEMRRFQEAGNKFLDNIGDAKAMNAAYDDIKLAKTNIRDLVRQNFSATGDVAQSITNINQVLSAQEKTIAQFKDGAQVLSAFKAANKDGFSPREFQQQMRDIYMSGNRNTFTEAVGQAAGRGADITQLMDKSRSINIGIPFLKKYGVGVDIPMGAKYIGTVSQQNPMAEAVGINAIRSFFGKDNK